MVSCKSTFSNPHTLWGRIGLENCSLIPKLHWEILTLRQVFTNNHGKSADVQVPKPFSKDCPFLGAGEESEAGRRGDPHLERNQPGAFLPLNIKCQISNIPADFHASPALRREGGFWCFKAYSPAFFFKHCN